MAFELWDVEANKYLGRFENERDALILVQMLVAHYGRDYADKLDLGEVTGEGVHPEPLSGTALADRADMVLDGHGHDDQGDLVASPISSVRTS